MRAPTLLRTIWLLGGVALLLAAAREPLLSLIPRARELPRADGAVGKPWVSGGFVFHEIDAGLLPPHIPRVGSWVGEDQWQGEAATAWFRASRAIIHVGIAGYPQAPGCKVSAEFRTADDRLIRVDCPITNPRERWGVWEIRRPADAVAVRILAEDRTSAVAGWVAFSHPFRAWPGMVTSAYLMLQLFTTTALVLTLLWGPGLFWPRSPATPETRLVILLGIGPIVLALLGIVIWCCSGAIRPQMSGLGGVLALWISLGVAARRREFNFEASRAMRGMLGVSALMAVAVIAKSTYSVGPPGELFRGTVSRNMEMSDRIDSRFSFYVVQAAAHHEGPASPATEKFYAPWTFFSRGPLAGLITIPVVMATNGQPPTTLPENRWRPFDGTGFAAYRITMIVLSSSVVMALFMTLSPIVGERWALVAGGLLALSPFGVHEMFFTWPKWAATAWLLASFGLAHARRPLSAGLALGVGFLFHPLALLWAPWIAIWAAVREERRVRTIARTFLHFAVGTSVLVAPWIALGALMPHLPTTPLAGQAGFFRYWKLADWKYATWDTWLQTRWMNFANTFVPLHLFFSDASFNHPKLGSAYEESGRLVKFSQLWWTSLPFGLGLGLWGLSLAALGRALQRLLAPTVIFVIAPALFITGYWGMDPLGLMRECGHPLFVAIIAITCVVAARHGGALRAILLHRSIPWLQLPETWVMLWLTTLLNSAPPAVEFEHFDAVYFATNIAALGSVAWLLAQERATVPDLVPTRSAANGARVLPCNPAT